MDNNNAKALKSGIWYTASNFLVGSIGFITTPIFTRLLTKAEFGAYNNYTSWLSIITIFVTLHIEASMISARYDFKSNLDSYILSSLALSSLSTLLWGIVFNVFYPFFGPLMDLDRIYINVMLVYLLFTPAIHMYQSRERYMFRYKNTAISSLIISITTALLSVSLVVLLDNKLYGRIIGAALPSILFGVFFYLYCRKDV